MKNVAVVCSCLSLCLWVNVGAAAPASLPDILLEYFVQIARNQDEPRIEVIASKGI